MTAKDYEAFRKALLARRRLLVGDLDHMEDEALKNAKDEAATMDISDFADLGSDNYERELTLSLMEQNQATVREIDDALARIDNGTFGVCEVCECKIKKPRLRLRPYARLCVKCQAEEEQGRAAL